jgi:hypothetical protein
MIKRYNVVRVYYRLLICGGDNLYLHKVAENTGLFEPFYSVTRARICKR